uniref:FXYD domain-containing ion transport regulator n=1 Tax=Molossus molossus TaxID=27622 RepID=A0A7J8DQD0_MOLMO|nr:hypothetical protein HJG59_009296 [Molossus molossus]
MTTYRCACRSYRSHRVYIRAIAHYNNSSCELSSIIRCDHTINIQSIVALGEAVEFKEVEPTQLNTAQQPPQTCSVHPALRRAQEKRLSDPNSSFNYDWEGLQLGGMVCAGLLCVAGLLFALSGKCKCKHNRKRSPLPEKDVPLVTSGSASTC